MDENTEISSELLDLEHLNKITQFLQQRQVIAITFRFRVDGDYQRTTLPIPTASTAIDEIPSNLSLEMLFVYQSADGGKHYFTIKNKTWDPQQTAQLALLFTYSATYIGHDLNRDICWLFHFQFSIPDKVWDLRIVHRAMTLGTLNCKARTSWSCHQTDETDSKQTLKQQVQDRLALLSIATAHDVSCRTSSTMMLMLKIYSKQGLKARHQNIVKYLTCIEMPWLIANTHMIYFGLRIDQEKQQQLLAAAGDRSSRLHEQLLQQGVTSPFSSTELEQYFYEHNLLNLFHKPTGGYSFSDNLLETQEQLPPAIKLIRECRKVDNIKSLQQAVAQQISSSGLIHPNHVQLGTETGRQTCHNPNVLGFDRVQRNLVIPRDGYGIGEVDYSQHEVGVVAGLCDDDELIRMYNSGDVYTQIAQLFYARSSKIETGAELWDSASFRQRYPVLRNKIKPVTLAILYGQSAHGLGSKMNIDSQHAQRFIDKLLDPFPKVKYALKEGVTQALSRKYVELVGGLRIALDQDSSVGDSTRRRLAKNYPVQGSGAIVFKMAGAALFRAYKPYNARLLVPMHDAFIYEAPLGNLEQVTKLTSDIMIESMRYYFPALHPRVDANISYPQRWIKEGCAEALEEFVGLAQN